MTVSGKVIPVKKQAVRKRRCPSARHLLRSFAGPRDRFSYVRLRSTSSRVGTESAAPGRVTDRAEAQLAVRMQSARGSPRMSAVGIRFHEQKQKGEQR